MRVNLPRGGLIGLTKKANFVVGDSDAAQSFLYDRAIKDSRVFYQEVTCHVFLFSCLVSSKGSADERGR